jgi:hypothetical protein
VSRLKDWEVVVTFRGREVEHHKGMTRVGARMAANGMNSTFARGARVVQRGGFFTAPIYESVPMYATARPSAQTETESRVVD